MLLWRISNHITLDGNDGMRYSARWHRAGHRIVYLAETPAGAMLEVLVHLELDQHELPPAYTLLGVEVPPSVAIEKLRVPIGDAWLKAAATAVASVPSAILPATQNYLLNPEHAAARRMKIRRVEKQSFDIRLLREIRSS
jgi:RES domain-containing protein